MNGWGGIDRVVDKFLTGRKIADNAKIVFLSLYLSIDPVFFVI
jgi:hypothetical protein